MNQPPTRPNLRSPRLSLRPLAFSDADDLVAMNGDREVMAYIGPPITPDQVAAELPSWVAGDGAFGLWVGRLDGALDDFVGVWFLSRDPDDGQAGRIGWRLARSAWGHGYAVEGARAIAAHAFATLGLPRLTAETMAVNTRSRRVMERLGMRLERTYVGTWETPIPGWEEGEVVYALTVPGAPLSSGSSA